MKAFTDDELIEYVLGNVSPARATELEACAGNDIELAATIDLLRALAGPPGGLTDATSDTTPTGPRSPLTRRWSIFGHRRRVLVSALVLLGLTGAAWCGWQIISNRTLVQDSFSSGWIDTRIWDLGLGRPFIQPEHGYLRLVNRGSVVTKREFEEPIEIAFDWRYLDTAGDPLYAENLTIALRTSGQHSRTHSYQIRDGIVVHLSTMGARVAVGSPLDDNFQVFTPDGTVPMPANTWHNVRLTDDGEEIALYLLGPKIDPKYERTPVIAVRPPLPPARGRIAIFNREFVGNARHESHIDNFVIRPLRR